MNESGQHASRRDLFLRAPIERLRCSKRLLNVGRLRYAILSATDVSQDQWLDLDILFSVHANRGFDRLFLLSGD